MNIYAKKGTKVQYVGTCDEAVKWGSNNDPRNYLTKNEYYTIESTEIHTWHTKIYLQEFPNLKFNSSSFKDETDLPDQLELFDV